VEFHRGEKEEIGSHVHHPFVSLGERVSSQGRAVRLGLGRLGSLSRGHADYKCVGETCMRHATVLEHTVIGRELLGRGWVQALLCAMLCGEIHQHCERVIKSTPGGFPGANIAGQTHTSVQAGYDGVGR